MDKKGFTLTKLSIFRMAVFVIVIAFLAILYYLTKVPHYVILQDPPFPKGTLTFYEEKSTREWYSGNEPFSKTNIWRKEFLVGFNCCDELKSREKILTFLDVWLSGQGWERYADTGDPCANMSETEFLDRDVGYVPYVPKGTKTLSHTPSVCIAVWPAVRTADEFLVLVVSSDR